MSRHVELLLLWRVKDGNSTIPHGADLVTNLSHSLVYYKRHGSGRNSILLSLRICKMDRFQVQTFDDGSKYSTNPYVTIADTHTGQLFVAMSLLKGGTCTVFDFKDMSVLSKFNWTVSGKYVYTTEQSNRTTMHSIIMGPAPEAMTVDHFNTEQMDNRRANLRWATQGVQNSNRDIRGDRQEVPSFLDRYKFSSMPRGVRWDEALQRFTFRDLLDATSYSPSGYNGTRCSECSVEGRYLDILNKYIAYIERCSPEVVKATEHYDQQKVLRDEFFQLVNAAHNAYPWIGSVSSQDKELWRPELDLILAKNQRDVLLSNSVCVKSGYANHVLKGNYDVPLSCGGSCVVRLEDEYVTIYDSDFREFLDQVHWYCEKTTGPRVSVNVDRARPRLADYVWKTLAKRDIPDGFFVAAINYQPYDVRLANLALFPGTSGRSNKARAISKIPMEVQAEVGLRYLPRSIYLSNDSGDAYLVRVMQNGKKVASAGAKSIRQLGPVLLQMIAKARSVISDFDDVNAVFQKRSIEYEEIMSYISDTFM